MMEGNLEEIETKFGLTNDKAVDEPTVHFSKEDRIEDAKLNKMAK